MELEFTYVSTRRKRIIATLSTIAVVVVLTGIITTAVLLTRKQDPASEETTQQLQLDASTDGTATYQSGALFLEGFVAEDEFRGNDKGQKRNVIHKHSCSHGRRKDQPTSSGNNNQRQNDDDETDDIKNIRKFKPFKREKGGKDHDKRSLHGTTIRITSDFGLMAAGADSRVCTSVGQTITNVGDGYSNTYTCTSKDLYTAARVTSAQSIIADATALIQTFLQMHTTTPNLDLTSAPASYTCGSGTVSIPSQYKVTGGTPTDFVMLWGIRPCNSASTLAYAGACLSWCADANCVRMNRPIVGYGNLCPVLFDNDLTDAYTRNYVVRVVVHEFLHALGFSSGFYNSYIDKTTGTYYTNPVVTTTSTNGSSTITTKSVTTPGVVAFAKAYTGCSTLTSVPMENSDGGSHFEDSLFGNEVMAPVAGHMILSGFTLNFINDFGWYDVDLTKAERKRYGYQAGCGFFTGRCNDVVPSAKFCTANTVQCDRDRLHGGICKQYTYGSALPNQQQYFSNAVLGGSSSFSDYCMKTVDYSNIYCDKATGSQITDHYDTYGPGSACFDVIEGASTADVACYPWRCYQSSTVALTLQIKPSNSATYINCPAGTTVTYGGFKVTCPSPVGLFCDGVTPVCDRACTGKCGGVADGCGGSCTSCPTGQTCSGTTCVNSTGCTPSCTGKCGGASDGCTGTCTAACPTGQTCSSQTCVSSCTPSCTGKCGGASDGCTGTCTAACPTGQTCSSQTCVTSCTPSCTGKCGGAANGCGGTCTASCPTGQTCSSQTCVSSCTPSCTGKCGGVSDGCSGTCSTTCVRDSTFDSPTGNWSVTNTANIVGVTSANCVSSGKCVRFTATTSAITLKSVVAGAVSTNGGCYLRFYIKQTTTGATSTLTANYKCSTTVQQTATFNAASATTLTQKTLQLTSACASAATYEFTVSAGSGTWYLDSVTVC